MPEMSPYQLAEKAIAAIDRGDTLHGLITLECSPTLREIPIVNSYLAYCIAKERGQVKDAIRMCEAALADEPRNPAHYLNLGRVLLLADDKAKAISTFWKGISKDPATEIGTAVDKPRNGHSRQHALILDELRRLGIRKRVPFRALGREHPLNVVVGKLLASVGVR
jgi:hypothetical protein